MSGIGGIYKSENTQQADHQRPGSFAEESWRAKWPKVTKTGHKIVEKRRRGKMVARQDHSFRGTVPEQSAWFISAAQQSLVQVYMLVPVEQYSPLWPLSADACRWSFAEKPSVVKVWYRPQLKCGTSVVGTMVHTSSLSSASPASSCFASWLGALMRHCMPCVWCLHNLTSPTQKSARECSHLTAWDKISFYFFNESIPGWPVATLCLSIPLISD